MPKPTGRIIGLGVLAGVCVLGFFGTLAALNAGASMPPTGFAIATASPSTAEPTPGYDPAGPVPTGVNGVGLTIGIMSDAGLDASPDLIAVIATNGRTGFVPKVLYEATVAPPAGLTPEQAATLSPAPIELPVYEVDGVTRVGVFIIGT